MSETRCFHLDERNCYLVYLWAERDNFHKLCRTQAASSRKKVLGDAAHQCTHPGHLHCRAPLLHPHRYRRRCYSGRSVGRWGLQISPVGRGGGDPAEESRSEHTTERRPIRLWTGSHWWPPPVNQLVTQLTHLISFTLCHDTPPLTYVSRLK